MTQRFNLKMEGKPFKYLMPYYFYNDLRDAVSHSDDKKKDDKKITELVNNLILEDEKIAEDIKRHSYSQMFNSTKSETVNALIYNFLIERARNVKQSEMTFTD